ncbi:MAG: ATP-binding cassette domain-containing protein [Archangium sp.]|nr:ATP-binding cassette domain-containing protein [Archangium sp.]
MAANLPTAAQLEARWSLAVLLTPAQRQLLLSDATFEAYSAGQPIKRSTQPNQVSLVFSGEVSLFARFDRTVPRGQVSAGRVIELRTLLTNETHWQNDWYAETPCAVLSFARGAFDTILEQTPKLRDYVTRTSEHAELEKLATDLRFFGFSELEIELTIAALALTPLQTSSEARPAKAFLAVVHEGGLTLSSEGPRPRVIASYAPGDYLLIGGQSGVTWDIKAHTRVWLVSREQWPQLVNPAKAQQFLAFADPFTSAEASQSLKQSQTQAPANADTPKVLDDEDDDDGLEVEHFQCDEDELAKLRRRKRPIVLQHEEMDCGAACMSMVTQFYGRHVTVASFRSLVQVSKDGASMLALKQAASHVGFEAIGVMASLKGLEGLRLPFIALCEYHFVVVYEFDDKRVKVGDPAMGLVERSLDDFQKDYSQVALLLKPTERLQTFPESRQELWKYGALLNGSWAQLGEIVLVSLLTFVLGLATPLFLQFVFDAVLVEQKKGLLNALALGVLVLNGVSGLASWVRGYLTTHLASRLDAKFSTLFMKHVLSLPLAFFAVRRVGDITTRLDQLREVREFATSKFPSLLINALTATAYIAILAAYQWKLVGLVVLCLVPLVAVVVLMNKRLNLNLTKGFKAGGKVASLTFEHFSSLETIKSLDATVTARWRWQHAVAEGLKLRLEFLNWSGFVQSFSGFLQALSALVFLVVTALLYMRQELTLGQVVAVNTLLGSVLGPLFSIVQEWSSMKELSRSLTRIDDVVTSPSEERDEEGDDVAPPPSTAKGGIELRGVGFQYGGDLSPQVLEDISIKVEPGSTVAFVGRSGSGKTTLGYMINHLYAPTQGKVFIDGVDTSQAPLDWVRRQVGVIVQDNSVFSGSILENIALGDPSPSFNRVMEAAVAADAHEFIAKLPDGYSTLLGEGGSGLSGGQRQRLNIARAFYRDPPILVMDEATSALDAISEQRIVRGIKKRKKTTIVIAHRLNTIMHADTIVVLDNGHLVELGNHFALMERRGLYFDLFRRQMSA